MQILTVPNPVLTQKAEEITDFSQIKTLAEEMIITAQNSNLAGLAANQVGVLQRIFIVNLGMGENSNWQAFINPNIKYLPERGKNWAFEGCASLPVFEYMIERCNSIHITAQSITGNFFKMSLQGFLARTAQHENDHLNAILISSKGKQRRLKGKN